MITYEKLVKHRLIDLDMTQTELAKKVNEITGLHTDQSYISRNLTGECKSKRVISAINEILGIEVSA